MLASSSPSSGKKNTTCRHPLQLILEALEPLHTPHKGDDAHSTSSGLSLSQLVPVHETFLHHQRGQLQQPEQQQQQQQQESSTAGKQTNQAVLPNDQKSWIQSLSQDTNLTTDDIHETFRLLLAATHDPLPQEPLENNNHTTEESDLTTTIDHSPRDDRHGRKCQVLLAIQYLLLHSIRREDASSCQHSVEFALKGLVQVLLPFLEIVMHQSTSTSIDSSLVFLLLEDEDHHHSSPSSAGRQEELTTTSSSRKTLLEVLFDATWKNGSRTTTTKPKPSEPSTNNNTSDDWMSLALQWIRKAESSEVFANTRNQRLFWKAHSLCLLGLYDLCGIQQTNDTAHSKLVLDTISSFGQSGLRHVLPLLSLSYSEQVLDSATQTRSRRGPNSEQQEEEGVETTTPSCLVLIPSDILYPILHVFLPKLLPDYAVLWWTFVWDELLDCDQASANDGTGNTLEVHAVPWMVGTAVLCALLPYVGHVAMPSRDNQSSSSLPIHQGRLWQLIQTCLKQGVHLGKKRAWITESYQKTTSGTTTLNTSRLDASWSELFRRRGLYLLRILVQPPHPNHGQETTSTTQSGRLSDWNRYVACMEAMEMESEPHLIDQVWETVQELASHCVTEPTTGNNDNEDASAPLPLTWSWMHLLWSRVLLAPDAPALRKASICQLCQGKAGIVLASTPSVLELDPKHKTNKQKNKKKESVPQGMSLHMVTNEFVLHVILPSFDSLEQSVGTHMHYEQGGKTIKVPIVDLVESFLQAFVNDVIQRKDNRKLAHLVETLLQIHTLVSIRTKTVVFAIELVAQQLSQANVSVIMNNREFWREAAKSVSFVFSPGYIVPSYRESILVSLASVLSCTEMPAKQMDAHAILEVLSLYPLPSLLEANQDTWKKDQPSFASLRKWLQGIQNKVGPVWGKTVASTFASAFVNGDLSGANHSEAEFDSRRKGSFADADLDTGRSIILLCSLLSDSPSELLWPAIHKGLSLAPSVELNQWYQADKAGRALILMEYGCKLKLVSGNGNGDLLVDGSTQQMVPPPPSIEQLISWAVNFLMFRIKGLVRSSEYEANKWNSSRSSDAKKTTRDLLSIIGSLNTLRESYPSSFALSNLLDTLLLGLSRETTNNAVPPLEQMLIIFATLSGGAQSSALLALCNKVLGLEYTVSNGESEHQPFRSIFQCSKWGSLEILSTQVAATNETEGREFLRRLFAVASDSIEACPSEGLVFLLNAMITSIKSGALYDEQSGITIDIVVDKLFFAFDASDNAVDSFYILDEICSILFSGESLVSEYKRHLADPQAPTPIRTAFRRIRDMASTQRPHILHIALSKVCVGWMGTDEQKLGLPSLLYKEDILELIAYKEDHIEASSVGGLSNSIDLPQQLPSGTHAQSIARAFILCFLDQLQNQGPNLAEEVRTELLHFLILRLIKDSKSRDPRHMVMLGSPIYSHKIRCWQGLTILARSVSPEIAEQVCTMTFETLQESLHGQVRFFVEIFCIQCSRRHPSIFGRKIESEITRCDLNLQEIASMMVIAGNLYIGKYKTDFLVEENAINLHAILAGASPWLSSTQGFSRAIAQILVHELIPKAIDVSVESEAEQHDNNWYLHSLFRFLDQNPEMKRLRSKQRKFFEKYDVDKACTPEHGFSMPVDEGGDVLPENMIDIIKKTLVEVYDEAHGQDAPTWKRVKEMVQSDQSVETDDCLTSPNEVNFQRKIIPLETLNLAFEEARERRLRNVAGRRKQPLIVCAALIDKIPNLGGLARTAEIFAATKLVIPDKNAAKMDNFTSLSVGAGDWIEIEECTEQVRYSMDFLFGRSNTNDDLSLKYTKICSEF